MTHPDVITTIWDDPRNVESLKAMWGEGKSASQIAAAMSASLGVRVSRSAVIGKVHRLKLQRRDPIAARQMQAARLRTVNGEIPKKGGAGAPGQAKANHTIHRVEGRLKAERARQAGKLSHAGHAPFRQGKMPRDEAGVDVTALVGIMDLSAHTCRWPVGDPLEPTFGFCGAPPVEGKSYCEDHCRRAFVTLGVGA